MNPYYLFAVFGTRILNFAIVVYLSHVLSGGDFGKYSIVTTDALFLHLVLTSWVANSLWRDASQAGEKLGATKILSALRLSYKIAGVELACAVLAFLFLQLDLRYLVALLVLSPLILVSETMLTALNARGHSRDYGVLAFLRGAYSLGFAIVFVAAGGGLIGAIFAQFAGIPFALISNRRSRTTAVAAITTPAAFAAAFEKLRFGLTGAVALNLYMIGNALARNVIALRTGEADAGYFSLAGDLFYAPVALFATAFSLSLIPKLYQATAQSSSTGTGTDSSDGTELPRQFLLVNLAISVPYAIGGWFLAPLLAHLILSPGSAERVAAIAGLGAVQGGCFAMLSAVTTLTLTSGNARRTLALSLSSVVLIVVPSATAGAMLDAMARAFTIGLFATVLIACLLQRSVMPATLPLLPVAKILVAAILTVPVLLAVRERPPLVAVTFGVGGAAIVYLTAGILLRSREITGLLRLRST